MIPVADLHCDLLCYLEENPSRRPSDAAVRCAIPQLLAGNVKWQACAIFTHTTPFSVKKGMAQLDLFEKITRQFSDSGLSLLFAFENASGFCNEMESFEEGWTRLHAVIERVATPFYISLTWNEENRFGGGAHTKIGLKKDGKRLLEKLHGLNIAIDLSHASDYLAYDLIEFIDNHKLNLPLLASHSNARSVAAVPRNLPADIAREIFSRGGLVGLNLYAPFLGDSEESILHHLTFWLELGGENNICLGSDFFYEADFPSNRKGAPFFKSFSNASCYPRLLAFIRKELRMADTFIQQLAHGNFLSFLERKNLSIDNCMLGAAF